MNQRIRNPLVKSIKAVIFLSLFSAPSAWSNSANLSPGERAKQAYRAGDYANALVLFKQAHRNSPSYNNRYNQAICHYKLDEWQQAESIFRKLHQEDPNNEVVQLNLALSLAKQGKSNEALKHFDWLSLAAESDKIAALALKNYQRVSKQGQLEAESSADNSSKGSTWLLNASLGYGTDDNVISVEDEVASQTQDTFLETSLSAAWLSSSDFDRAWSIDGSYYTSQYSDESPYDISVIALGIKKHFPLATNHRVHLGFRVDETDIGDQGYLRTYSLELGNRQKLSKSTVLKYGLRLQKMDELSDSYKANAGNNTRLYAQLNQYLAKHSLTLRYRYDVDDKNDRIVEQEELPSLFTSYSADRHSIYGSWVYQPGKLSTQLFMQYKISRYDGANGVFDDELNLSLIERSDDRLSGGAKLEYEFTPKWGVELSWTYTDNSSNIDNYSYDQNMLTAALNWQN